ncbi:MAG: hypothetical protein Athens071425_244 [Parcubacteria group bacterium Athens0714_25]|nr:MAG: hypothetical protein Athens071425_244 [Parcubacteria group bacterium Athens0714_25]
MKLRQTLFWDVNPEKIDIDKNARYVIERVLDFGNDREVRWVAQYYDKSFLKKIIMESRSLHPRTKALWTLMLEKK